MDELDQAKLSRTEMARLRHACKMKNVFDAHRLVLAAEEERRLVQALSVLG
jgi:hypothetical protein